MGRTLYFKFLGSPVEAKINEDGGRYRAPRKSGPHKGLDYLAYLSVVRAVEDGMVVYSDERKGSVDKTNYGNVVVIDHTPKAKKDQRHIYTLYAHLDKGSVSTGSVVKKLDKVSISGNTGMKQSYEKKIPKRKQRGYHLHFEVIDSPKGIDFSSGWPSELDSGKYRENPSDYLSRSLTVKYPFTAEEIKKIKGELSFELKMNQERLGWSVDVAFQGKSIGQLDKERCEIKSTVSADILKGF